MNSSKLRTDLAIIIPVYNEENAITSTLKQIHNLFCKLDVRYEIIVINDGSNDSTGNILKANVKKYNFTLLEHEKNKGYGAAIKTGVNFTESQYIAITDADGTYPNEQLPILYSFIKDHDMVVGSRPFNSLPTKTKPVKWFINKLANYIVDYEIPDINSGLRIFKKSAFLPFLKIIPNGFSLTTTITLGMILSGYIVKYIPVEYYKREGKSKIKPIRDTINFVKLIMKMGLYFAPLKIFLPISIIFFISSIIWGVISLFILGKLADTSTLLLMMFSLQVAVVALIAELINHRIPNFYNKK